MSSLAGRVAIVTGGASGIGRATAIALAERSARVFVGDVQKPAESAETFTRLGIHQQSCDVRKEADVRGLVAAPSRTVDAWISSSAMPASASSSKYPR